MPRARQRAASARAVNPKPKASSMRKFFPDLACAQTPCHVATLAARTVGVNAIRAKIAL
jgi:hypothetical protein